MATNDDDPNKSSVSSDPEDRAGSFHHLASDRITPASFQLLVESVKDYAIFMLDPRGVVATWNLGARRIKGYSASEIIGKHFSIFYPREDVAAGKCEWELEVAAKEGRFEDEGWRLRNDGSRFWANVIITALRDESGELVGFAKVTRDLTERRIAEQERLRAAQERFELERMQEANRIKDQFLATISHELRTPLNAIVGWAELMNSGEDPTIGKKAVETILRNAQAQIAIIDDMLDMSRIATGKMRLEIGAVDLARIVRDAVEVVRPAADARNIQFELQGVESPLPHVGDPVRLQQVAWNFLSNAVKFSHAGGKVTVSLQREASSLMLTVSDQGQGIDRAFLPHVFEPFRQAEEGTARRKGGVGLGLAIAKHIVELHGGVVSVASEGVGKGASFVVKLPVRPILPEQEEPIVPAQKRRSDARAGGAQDLSDVRVLVVDDEADARELLQVLFRARRAVVRLAASASEAREAVESFSPDIIICDIGMPGEDGYQLLRSLRALPDHRGGATPAIALTAYAHEKDLRRAIEAGFNYHLAKPTDIPTLLSVMQNLLKLSGARPRPS